MLATIAIYFMIKSNDSKSLIPLWVGSPSHKAASGKEQGSALVTHYCVGLNQDKSVLFQGEIELALLSYILQK
jgi:hypothetical protein